MQSVHDSLIRFIVIMMGCLRFRETLSHAWINITGPPPAPTSPTTISPTLPPGLFAFEIARLYALEISIIKINEQIRH